ncbi:MAG: hypothetical protein M1823_007859, partial [Watsoniomyces obsoletus]
MVDLISSRVVNQMPGTPIRRDDSLKIILANDKRMTLDGYVSVHVNVEGVTATVKAFVMPEATGYGLLLGLRWLRLVHSSVEYGSKRMTITGTDSVTRVIPVRDVPAGVQEEVPRGLDAGGEADDESSDVDRMLRRIIEEDEEETWLDDGA